MNVVTVPRQTHKGRGHRQGGGLMLRSEILFSGDNPVHCAMCVGLGTDQWMPSKELDMKR